MATIFQLWGVQHVNGSNRPPYRTLLDAGYRAIFFRPEDPNTGQYIAEAKVKGFGVSGLWFADPGSSDSLKHGIRGDAVGFAEDVVRIVKELDVKTGINTDGRTCSPQMVQLNIEFAGKGYPSWAPNVAVKAWQRCTANGWEWQTWSDGKTGPTRPNFAGDGLTPLFASAAVQDGNVQWHALGPAIFDGWDWNEIVMERLRRSVGNGGLPLRPLEVQPMGHQDDFNYGAYLKQRQYAVLNGVPLFSPPVRISPQCYDGSMNPTSPKANIDEIVNNSYVKSYYGIDVPRSYIHPTIASANASYYVPRLPDVGGIRGYTLFREDGMGADDFTAYKPFMAA